MKLADISRFDKISDYLPILNAVLFTDLFFMGVLYYTPLLKSKNLARWYETYRLSGMLCDVTIIMIGFVIARAIYYKIFKEFTPWKFIVLLVVIQVIHDLLFAGAFYSIPKGVNKMIDMFKDYGNEHGAGAIVGDSLMMVMAGFLAMTLSNWGKNANIIILLVLLYFTPYILYTK
jgi:hypothetical protein